MTQDSMGYQPFFLHSGCGERKYLTQTERRRFFEALDVLDDPKKQTFAEMIFWTGCRPSEALRLSSSSIDLDEGNVVIRSSKKRGELKGRHFRLVPLPLEFVNRLASVHSLRELHSYAEGEELLWEFSRTTGWRVIRSVMKSCRLHGIRSCARGLRHSFGVHGALSQVPETRLQKWMGHASLSTTAIYTDVMGTEEREIAKRMWS